MATKQKTAADRKLRNDSTGRSGSNQEGPGQPRNDKSRAGIGVPSISTAATQVGSQPRPKSGSKPAPATIPRRSNGPKAADSPLSVATVAEVRSAKAIHVASTRKELGLTQEVFARMIGVSPRSIAGWERGSPINESSYRRIREMDRLASTLKKVMKANFIPQWLVTSNEGMGGISPVQALESGANDRFWRAVFLLGSGLPL